MRPSISAIVPSYNALPYLAESLESIDRARKRYQGSVELIVVDNLSTDGSFDEASNWVGENDCLIQTDAATVGEVRNIGAREAYGELLAFIDSDTLIKPIHFERTVEVMSESKACATGAMVKVERSAGRIPYAWYNLQRHPESGFVEYLNSANIIIRRSAFEAVGGFDEALRSGEDADVCLRLREQGCNIYECLDLTAVHRDNPSTLRSFVRQQVWHGLGMFSTVRSTIIDKPVVATLGYGLGGVIPAAVAATTGLNAISAAIASAGATSLVAIAATAFRTWKAGRVLLPLTTIGLYHLYFISRLLALFLLLGPTRRDT